LINGKLPVAKTGHYNQKNVLLPASIAGIVWLLALQKLYTIGWLRAFVIAVFIWIVTSIAGWFLPVL